MTYTQKTISDRRITVLKRLVRASRHISASLTQQKIAFKLKVCKLFMVKSKIIYDKVGCIYCSGQIMSICFGRMMISSKCIKCGRDIKKYVTEPRSTCKEERIGRLMHRYYAQRIQTNRKI